MSKLSMRNNNNKTSCYYFVAKAINLPQINKYNTIQKKAKLWTRALLCDHLYVNDGAMDELDTL